MNKAQARREALSRAVGTLQSYLNEGALSNVYSELSEKDIGRINDALVSIIDELYRKLETASVPDPNRRRR